MDNDSDDESEGLFVCQDREDLCPLDSGYKDDIDVSGNHFEYTYAQHKIRNERQSMRVYMCHHRFHLHIATKLKEKLLSCYVPLSSIPLRAKRYCRERTQVSKNAHCWSPVVTRISYPYGSSLHGPPVIPDPKQ